MTYPVHHLARMNEQLFQAIASRFITNDETEMLRVYLGLTALGRSYEGAMGLLEDCACLPMHEVHCKLFNENLHCIKQDFFADQPVIGIWWSPGCLGSHLTPIAKRIWQERNYGYLGLVSFSYLDSQALRKIGEFDFADYMPIPDDRLLKTLDFLNLVVLTEDYRSSTNFPQKVIRVCQPHGLDISFHASLVKYGGGLIFDYILCPMVEQHGPVDKYKGVFPRELVEHASNVTCAVPMGYPKLDDFIHHCDKRPPSKKIVYHISLLGVESEEVRSNIGRVIRLLLEGFPDREILFRPDPADQNHPELVFQLSEFKGHPKFSFSRASSYIEDYSDAEVLVTHRSVTAHTFAYATGRPIVVYPFQNLLRRATVNPLGYTVYCDQQLLKKVKASIDAPEKWKLKIDAVLKSRINNPGSSLDFLIESLPLMLERKYDAGWGRYELFDESEGRSSAETVSKKIRSGMQLGYRMSCTAEAAIEKFSENAEVKWIASQVYAGVSDPFKSTYYFQYWYRSVELALKAYYGLKQEGCQKRSKEVLQWLLARGLGMALSVKWFLAKGGQAYGGSIDALISEIMKLDADAMQIRAFNPNRSKKLSTRIAIKLSKCLKFGILD